jgi:EmrB/QacA subfamily drug resistance transporter
MPSRSRWTLAATIIGTSMASLDATVVNVALAALQTDLDATITEVQWVVEAYALFLGGLILVGGSLGDQFGRKRAFLAGVGFFTAASVVCGLAASPAALIAGRALQGIGAAFLVPGSLAIITATFSEADRGRAIGTWSGASAITAAIGPLTGGWLIEHVSWRAVFFMNIPLAAAVVVLSLRFMDESRDPSRSARIDWTGATLAIVGLGGLVVGLIEWPPLGGDHPLVVTSLCIGAVALVLFVRVERRATNPTLPLQLFTSRTFSLVNLLTFLLYGGLSSVFVLVPMNLIQVHGYTATQAGAALLPLPLTIAAMSRWAGGLVSRVGSRLPLTAGPAVASLGVALYARPGLDGPYWTTFFPAAFVLGVGLALTVAPLTTTAMGAVGRNLAGVASGVSNAVSRVAGLLAIAAFSVVLARTFEGRVGSALDRLCLTASAREAIDRELPKMGGADISGLRSISPAQRLAVHDAIRGAFLSAFRLVMGVAAMLALLAAAVGALIPANRTAQSPMGTG